MQAASKGQKFYFINKSGNSTDLSRSQASEKSAVQRYVQTGRKRSRKIKDKTTSTDTESTLRRLRPSTTSISSNDDVSPLEGVIDLSPTTSASSMSKRSTQASPEEQQPVEQPIISSVTYQKLLYKQDPFNASSITINKHVAALLHYYLYYYHPSQWPNEMALLRHGVYIYQDNVTNIVRTAIADKLAMYCLLSAAACRLQFIDRLPSRLVVGTESHYIQQALQLMTSFIATADLEDKRQLWNAVNCMSFLNQAEAYRGNISAAKPHFDAAMRLLELNGGMAYLQDDCLHGQLAMADLYYACINFEPCALDCSYDPGPACTLFLEEYELQGPGVPTEANSLLNRQVLFISPRLEELVEELVDSHAVKTRISTSTMAAERAMQVTHWITMRNMAIRNKLLAMETTDARVDCLRMAMIMWTLFAMNITGRTKTVKLMAPKLKRILSAIPLAMWLNTEDIRLWIVLVGLYCADEGTEESIWFMNEYHYLGHGCVTHITATMSATELAEQLESFQLKFFFDIPVQRSRTLVIAGRLLLSSF